MMTTLMAAIDELVERIQKAEEDGLSRYELAKRSGVAYPVISRLTTGRRKAVTLATLERLLEALGLEIRFVPSKRKPRK